MLLRRPNPQSPDASPSPLTPKRWLGKDSGAVGLGIVAALDNSIISDSLAKFILTTAPVAIPSARPDRRRIDDCRRRQLKRDGGFFCGSPPTSCSEEITMPHFLSHCCLCRKRLHGKDIYMYMEKAFCSMECRYQQILSDEEHKRCKKMSKISCSPCSGGGRLFFTGVAVA